MVVMHVDQSLQLWAFLDVYGSTQSVRMFRQQLPNMVAAYNSGVINATPITSSRQVNVPASSESLNSLHSQTGDSRKIIQHYTPALMNTMNASNNNINGSSNSTSNLTVGTTSGVLSLNGANVSRGLISVPSTGDMIQIQPNGGGTVLVVNLPPATSALDLNSGSQTRLHSTDTSCNSNNSNNNNNHTISSNGNHIRSSNCATPHGEVSIAWKNYSVLSFLFFLKHFNKIDIIYFFLKYFLDSNIWLYNGRW